MILEKQCSDELKNFFKKLERKIHKIIDEYWESELGLFHLNKVSDLIQNSKQEYYNILFKYCRIQYLRSRKTAEKRFQSQLQKISIKADISITRLEDLFRPDPTIRYNLNNKVFQASTHTMNRVDNLIMTNLSESYSDGVGIEEAKNRLTVKYSGLKGYEAERIARTEINGAQNDGAFDSYSELGNEYHQWWTAQDERVRNGDRGTANHRILHGKIVKVGSTFSNGLLYPGDRQGSVSEWINCRCTTVPFIMPLGKMAPPNMTEFTEDDLIDIPGWQTPDLPDLIPADSQTPENIHLKNRTNPITRGRNSRVEYMENSYDIDFKKIEYDDGTVIEFSQNGEENTILKSVEIDGVKYEFLGDDSYDFFSYQMEDIIKNNEMEFLEEYTNTYATSKGIKLNTSLRNGSKLDGTLAKNHKKFVSLINNSKIKDNTVSYRIQQEIYEDENIIKKVITSKSHYSTTTGATKQDMKEAFLNTNPEGEYINPDDGEYWQIINVIPKKSDINALFIGNPIKNIRGYDWESELNFAPGQKFQRLLVDEENKIIIQTPVV